jgi:nucleotide-sensitive chloride channel 1A
VDPIFEALSACASLHPDPQGSDEDEDEFIDLENSGDFEVFTGAEGEELSEVGRVRSDFANNNRYQPY